MSNRLNASRISSICSSLSPGFFDLRLTRDMRFSTSCFVGEAFLPAREARVLDANLERRFNFVKF